MTAAANIECSSFIYGYSNLSRTRYTASTSMYAPEFTTAIENSQGCMEGGGGSGVSGNPLWYIIKIYAIASD